MSKLSANSKCPSCKQPIKAEYAPFCSQGCKDRDLLQWLDEGYKIPGHPADPDFNLNIGEED